MLIVAGFHVPVIPLIEVRGKAGGVLFRHSGPIAVKVGAVPAIVTIAMVVTEAHWPVAGVNV